MENVEKQETVQEQAPAAEAPKVTLLSAISYTNRADYESFLASMTGEHAVVALIAAANHAQARGAYNLDEAELVAKAIRRLTVQPAASAPVQPAEAEAVNSEPEAPKKATRSRKK
jgi:hypothetical protein